jgi:hypothetical protein
MQMKHDLEAFSRDIVALVKISGDTGDTGDTFEKPLKNRDNSVPKTRAALSPLGSNWGQAVAASGDRKSDILQSVADPVPSVPGATTKIQQGPAGDGGSDERSEWHAILAELKGQTSPEWLPPIRWRELLSDAESFLSRWEGAAQALGWTALDLFGVHPQAPASRFDAMGLFLLTQGGAVVALTKDGATFRRQTGAVLSYQRVSTADAVLIAGVRP